LKIREIATEVENSIHSRHLTDPATPHAKAAAEPYLPQDIHNADKIYKQLKTLYLHKMFHVEHFP
jgi:hypothetical protein